MNVTAVARGHLIDPFAATESLVLRDLFAAAESSGGHGPVGLAHMEMRTGLDPGAIRAITTSLGRRRLSTKRNDTITLIDPVRALSTWITSWRGHRQHTHSFHVGLAWTSLVSALAELWSGLDWAWTGVAGAALSADIGVPLQRVCYVAARDVHRACERLERSLRAVPVAPDCGGTVHVVVPVCPRSQLRYGRRIAHRGAPIVSTAQQLLDLVHGPGIVEHSPVADAARRETWAALVAGSEARSVDKSA